MRGSKGQVGVIGSSEKDDVEVLLETGVAQLLFTLQPNRAKAVMQSQTMEQRVENRVVVVDVTPHGA